MNDLEVLATLTITLAFFGESVFGFGGGLVAVPLLSLALGVKDAVTLVLIFQLLMGLLMWKSYKQIDWKSATPMTYAVILGTMVGTIALSHAGIVFLQLFLAVSITFFLLQTALQTEARVDNRFNIIAATASGFGGGVFQGLIGTGGPLLIMYLSAHIKDKLTLRATLIYLFFVSSVVRLGISISHNFFTEHVLSLAINALPIFLIVIYLGHHIHKKISEAYYRLAICIILGFSAILLFGKVLL